MASLSIAQDFVTEECVHCYAIFAVTEGANRLLRENRKSFWCPYCGGTMHYKTGQSDAAEIANLKRQLELEAETSRRLRNDADHFKNQRNALKGVITRTKRRIHNGVCPCCRRTFQNLREHMQKQHPDFLEEVG